MEGEAKGGERLSGATIRGGQNQTDYCGCRERDAEETSGRAGKKWSRGELNKNKKNENNNNSHHPEVYNQFKQTKVKYLPQCLHTELEAMRGQIGRLQAEKNDLVALNSELQLKMGQGSPRDSFIEIRIAVSMHIHTQTQ